jgi:acyl-CoA dehydrogenase
MGNNLSSASILEQVRRIADEVVGPAARSVDEEARFPSEAFAALRQVKLLSSYVPREYGGASGGAGGLTLSELAQHCEVLAERCASTAMVYAMHQIQVACVVRHAQGTPFFRDYLTQLVNEQRLIASVTSEAGVGGSTRTSIAPIQRDANGLCTVRKDGTVVSYGEAADDLLITMRRSAEAPASDQALVLVKRSECTLEKTASWDTMGMRGTCSLGYIVTASFPEAQIVPAPFGEVSAHTMVPFAHLLWSACWLGIATGAVAQARAYVRDTARKTPGVTPPSVLRLSEVSTQLQLMRLQSQTLAREFDELDAEPKRAKEVLSSLGFALKMNNLKISSSQLVVDITTQALRICGTSGYRNDSRFSVVRNLRDAHSAALMISNDRIHASSGPLHLVHKDE